MIFLQLNSTSEMYLQVTDLITYSPVFFYFIFKNEQTNEEFLKEIPNEIPLNRRVGKFTISVPADLDLKEGVFLLKIFESETTGSATLPVDAREISVETAKVVAEFEANKKYEPLGKDSVYQG